MHRTFMVWLEYYTKVTEGTQIYFSIDTLRCYTL